MTATAVADDDQTPEPDLSVLMPGAALIDVEGIPCRVRRLRSREALDLARIVAAGIGEAVSELDFDLDDPEAFKASVTALLLIALPNAERETFAFLRQVLVPEDRKDSGQLSTLMQNPDIGVALDVLDTLMDQEGEGLLGLLGKVRVLAAKVGKLLPSKPTAKAGATAGSRGRSRARST